MRILVGCEESQAVCKALRARGHEAYSCDRLPCSGGHPEWHIQGDVFKAVRSRKWDMFIVFPTCTYVCSSGLHWNKRVHGRAKKTDDALWFIAHLLNCAAIYGIPKVALENPVGCISTRIAYDSFVGYYVMDEPDSRKAIKPQYVQPYNFGDNASKKTALFLIGLPVLKKTRHTPGRQVLHKGKKVYRWDNQTDSGQNRETPHENRALIRSKTYPGLAQAMAKQWG